MSIASDNILLKSEPMMLVGSSMCVRWTGRSGASPASDGITTLNFAFTLISPDRALAHAYLETGRERLMILPQQPMRIMVVRDAGDAPLLHIDLERDGERVLALSMTACGKLLYARSPLLAEPELNINPGAFDPPALEFARTEREAVTA